MPINTLFQTHETPEPRSESSFEELEAPAELRTNLVQLLDWYTPNIFVTWIMLGINVLVFVAMLLSGVNPEHPSQPALLHWGANYGPSTLTQHEWWRLVTCTFAHGGLVHIFFNMLVLAQIGPFMERLLGNIAFFLAYLICAISGSLLSLLWHPYVVSVGASGAIFGLYGALIGFLILRHDSVPRQALQKILQGALVFLAFNVIVGLWNEGTDVAAHIGGLLAGLVAGLFISNPICKGFTRRSAIRSALLAGIILPVFFILLVFVPRPRDFLNELKNVSALETRINASWASLVGQARSGHLKDTDLAAQVQTQIIPPWRAERLRLSSFSQLPEPQKQTISLVLEYMASTEHSWTDLVRGLQTHDTRLIAQSFQTRARAGNKLKQSLSNPH